MTTILSRRLIVTASPASLLAAILAFILAGTLGFNAADANAADQYGPTLRPASRGFSDLAPKRCLDANATPVTIGANWVLTGGTAGGPETASVDQAAVVQLEINSSCGVRVGGANVGVPLAVLVADNANIPAQSAAATRALIDAGAVVVVGGGNSATAPPAAQVAVESDVPLGAHQAAADRLSGCTAAELGDPSVIKSPTPVYGAGRCWDNGGLVFRTTLSGHEWGAVTASYARATYPASSNAAIVYRNDDFGQPARDGFRDEFVRLGGAVLAEGGYVASTVTLTSLKALLQAVTAGNPSIIVAIPNVPQLKLLVQAYVELRDDPTWTTKPASFDAIRFMGVSTLSGATYSDVSAPTLDVLVNQTEFLQAAWNPDRKAFQEWFALYQAYDPDAQPPNSPWFMSAYDAFMVASLAITAAGTTDGPSIAARLREVANPPGKVVCPGQWRKAFRWLAMGKDINYEGALGPVDFDERGNATGFTYGVHNFRPDGSTALVGTFGLPAQQLDCDADDEEDGWADD
jgi:ABC-type branched-subunit amino acid transport system substrate-binding protein